MIVGDVIYPDNKAPRKKIICDACEISYSNSQYQNLSSNYKLLYLNTYSTELEYTYSVLCHDCFFANLGKIYKDYDLESEMVFSIMTKDSEIDMTFQPEELAEDIDAENDEEIPEVYIEDFIKDILES